MSEAADKIEAAMTANQAPVGGWDMPGLRRMTGLSVGAFAAGVATLRARGRMQAFDLVLVEPTEGAAAPEQPTLAQQVAAEAAEATMRKAHARSFGKGHVMAPSPGALLQERALTDAPALAASIMKDRWAPLWERVCAHARATHQRPIPAMLALLDSGLEKEARA